MFATHYHELTDMEDERIKNYCIAVKERGAKVAFLRRIIRGSADKSYGIHVARLAGLPKNVTQRAQEILDESPFPRKRLSKRRRRKKPP